MVRTTGLKNYSNVHYTRSGVAKAIVKHYKPEGVILEPFRGESAFYDQLPAGSLWCEIEQGRDFFKFKEHVDWIITNPPFENLTDIMRHAFQIADNTVFLVPLSKIYSSAPRLRMVRHVAGIKEIMHLGSGRDIGFNLGFPFAAMHFLKGYHGPVNETWPKEDCTGKH